MNIDLNTERINNKPISRVYNMDCMEFLKQCPDKYFSLACVDPPYGEVCNLEGGSSKSGKNGWSGLLSKASNWNVEPESEYFQELFRVSKNQIIWGANHFITKLPKNFSCFLIWDKGQRGFSLADCELAWTSFTGSARVFSYARGNESGFAPKLNAIDKRFANIHPTQKPIALYDWTLKNYAKPGDKILDTYLGSQSSRIAAYKLGFDFWGTELDADYFNQANERFQQSIAMPLFDAPKQTIQQLSLV